MQKDTLEQRLCRLRVAAEPDHWYDAIVPCILTIYRVKQTERGGENWRSVWRLRKQLAIKTAVVSLVVIAIYVLYFR